MKVLRSVVQNYDSEYKNQLSEIIANQFSEKQKQAFQIILEYSSLDDSALNKKLAHELYNNEPSHRAYRSFKEKFRNLLLKIVYLNESRGSDMQKIAFELHDEFNALSKLLYMGQKQIAHSQLKKLLTKSLKYHDFEIARSVALRIQGNYTLYGSQKQQEEAEYKYQLINNICQQQELIRCLFGDIHKTKNLTGKEKLSYQTLLNDLESNRKFDSFIYQYYYYSIKLIITSVDQYELICNEAIEYLLSLHFRHTGYISIFRIRLLKHKTSKGDFVSAKLVLNALMSEHRENTYHWYLHALTYVRVLIYSGDTKEALKWHKKIIESRNYKTQPLDHRIEWQVIGMYIFLLTDNIDKINLRRLNYNFNKLGNEYNKIDFLVAEIIYYIKINRPGVEKKIAQLEKLAKGNNRVIALCKSLSTGNRYRTKSISKFDSEIVEYEKLICLV